MFNLTFAIYSLATGEVLRWGQAPNNEQAELQLQDGEDIIFGDYDPLYTRVINGEPVNYTQEERHRRDNPPTFSHTWDSVTLAWVDKRTPEEINERMAIDVKAEMAVVEAGSMRAIREALLGQGTARVKEVNDRMVALRARLAEIAARPKG